MYKNVFNAQLKIVYLFLSTSLRVDTFFSSYSIKGMTCLLQNINRYL